MTIGPRAESLTLPEPARTIFSRTRAILDAYITPHTPDRSGWKIGGGTILAARWRHRESQDIDLLVHPRTETRFLQPSVTAGAAPSTRNARRKKDQLRSIQPDPLRRITD